MKAAKMKVMYTSSSNHGIAVAKGMTHEACQEARKKASCGLSLFEGFKGLPFIGFLFG